MSERGLHFIEDDLSDTWLEDWAGAGVAEAEDYLAKHAAFLRFLEADERKLSNPSSHFRSRLREACRVEQSRLRPTRRP